MRKLFDRLRPRFEEHGKHAAYRGLFQLLDRFLYSSPNATIGAPHVRDANNVQRLMNYFVIASIPCWLIGLWNLGEQTNFAMAQIGMTEAPGWRGTIMAAFGLGYNPQNVVACFFHGFLYFLPIFLVALLTGAFWESIFAQLRRRPVDEGLLAMAWLFALIMPATVPMYAVVLGMSFGIVVGKGIYGGMGRYLFSPVVLGFAFILFSFSDLFFGQGTWIPVPGYDEPTTVKLAIDEGGIAALQAVDYHWWQLFIGNQPGPIGITSILGCLLGAVFLIFSGMVSWRIMAGSLIGMIATVLLLNVLGPEDNPMFHVPWYWHFVIGGWAFATVFVATDPVAAATTNPGRWGFGILVGTLTIIVRVTNPSLFQGAVFAILLASVFSPLFDYFVMERNIKRRAQRARVTT
ncbi:MAG: RnfABCDGE type electron transport complex subunit D [Pseudomonadales bacterium]